LTRCSSFIDFRRHWQPAERTGTPKTGILSPNFRRNYRGFAIDTDKTNA
jgi:hypothetical protein